MTITLCGSARFEPWFKIWNEILSLEGYPVFTLSVYPSFKEAGKDWYTESEKIRMDRVHKQKINMSDAILVLNPFGYIGESTLNEIAHAEERHKDIYYLECWDKGAGLSGYHSVRYRALAEHFGIHDGYTSPITTTRNSPWLLLGAADAHRYSMVARYDAFEKSIRSLI